ncbi:ThuA domain-containing protein [Membranicola marinus]|uniref:ThuA domain-containing protein n=1 Tax=Membranihabitans marinus TaxID=1227546 RepID=A0A953HRT7_9BACT|nr:ThuA domain-containing protein [Membranihabitans marinus]MBY5956733.1 ThuA domain-containing protein [Membranihabitans marinus]
MVLLKIKELSLILTSMLFMSLMANCQSSKHFITFEPDRKTTSKHVVLISGDEEYRSEEGLPMLAKILSNHHGFRTTVLFAIHPETGSIDPNYQKNIPGLKALETADLMIIATRFRGLPDDQMKYIDDYLKAGKPVIGLRTATHAFKLDDPSSPYAKYSFNSKVSGWEGGFGKKILGETWINHHGHHGHEGTRGLVDGLAERNKHPVLNGVKDIWGPTDVYGITEIPDGAEVLLWGASTSGMTPEAPVNWKKSIIPVAWTKTYTYHSGSKEGRVFTTTMGAATDLVSADLRRMIINAAYWSLHMEDQITEELNVNLVGTFDPTEFGFNGFVKDKKPEDYE